MKISCCGQLTTNIHCTGGWVGPRAVCNTFWRRKRILPLLINKPQTTQPSA